MRCLALADTLKARGAATRFVCSTLPDTLAALLVGAGHELAPIPSLAAPVGAGPDWNWDLAVHPAAVQADDAYHTRAAAREADWTVVDHYGLDRHWEVAARGSGRVLVIDDLANRAHDCDLLVDQNFGAHRSDYRELVGPAAKLLCGSAFAILRPEFAAFRQAAIARRAERTGAGRILLSLGATDIGGITGEVLERLLAILPAGSEVDVVLGGGSPSGESVERMAKRDRRVTVHRAATRMAELICNADLAIGAAGISSWERCALGLPTIVLALAANQKRVLDRLAESGAVIAATDTVEAATRAAELIDDHDRLAAMSAAAFALADGKGSERVAARMVAEADEPAVLLRAATQSDSAAIWSWRNDPYSRQSSRSSEPVCWSDHDAWFARTLGREDVLLLLAEVDGEQSGVIRFERDGNDAEVSINLAPHLRGRGLAADLLRQACAALQAANPAVVSVTAAIGTDNAASTAAFRSAGFRPRGSLAVDGFALYERPLRALDATE